MSGEIIGYDYSGVPIYKVPRRTAKSEMIIGAYLHNQDPEPEYIIDDQGTPRPVGFEAGSLDLEQLRVLMEERTMATDPIRGNSKTSGAGEQRKAFHEDNGGWGNGIIE